MLKLSKAEQKKLSKLQSQADEANKIHEKALLWLAITMAWYFGFSIALFTENETGMLFSLGSALLAFFIHRHYDKKANKMLDGAIKGIEDMMKQQVVDFARKHPEKMVEIIKRGGKIDE